MTTPSDLITRLAHVQKHLHAPKNQRNTFGNYNYRSCEDIIEAVKPLLHEQGLVLTISDDLIYLGDRYYVKATATVTDGTTSTSSTAFAREAEDRKGMDPSQLTGATSSYARKYALNGLFAIDDNKDADTDAHTQQRQAHQDARQETHQAYEQQHQQPRPAPVQAPQRPAYQPTPQDQQRSTGYNGPQRSAGEGGPATDRQKAAIHKMAGKAGEDELALLNRLGVPGETWDTMSKGTAGLLITELGVILDGQ